MYTEAYESAERIRRSASLAASKHRELRELSTVLAKACELHTRVSDSIADYADERLSLAARALITYITQLQSESVRLCAELLALLHAAIRRASARMVLNEG